ncbi:non-hydrolyzing UDP-N-acetylglucosamine 2-epimerase [Qipengyuania atrilutea]|uniref:UDP-N-acetylglucosamine 2-epimerase (non-hydrolyzing) n=1 Tax=Qipengyuania atrilutea TaxID=2744473 RepID=A0A850H1L5_9SPHN|nr:UDP-N-acetylglucosamine 2-epimerase (non-hydrolyzing) [Actirhodobacter atriluteus]NVD44410.1 UDP-N-acetylglucosamine 2-epimerase (non-hydrolyzing) [Actirhodobacter atriluteus]
MTGPLKILTVFGTRPEAIKLFPVLHRLTGDARFTSRICVTGQHREMLDQVLDVARIEPDYDLDVMQPGQTPDELTARLLTGIGGVLDMEKPDVVLVQGDTTSALVAALAAYYRQIAVAHAEAGLRSGEKYRPWPEEINRKAITAIASLHFAPTQTAAISLEAESVDPASIHVTGNTAVDAVRWMAAKLDADSTLGAEVTEVLERFAEKRIIVLTAHRRESFEEGLGNIARAAATIAVREDVAIVCPVHPNPAVRPALENALNDRENVALVPPLGYAPFVRLLKASALLLTDSGGIQEEAAALGKPVLVMRDATERPEGIVAGTARLVGTQEIRIVSETERLLDDPQAYAAMANAKNPFGDGKAAQQICELLARMTPANRQT